MRVVAGEARGRRLVAPEGDVARPTTDRVREAVFNALGSLDAVVGATVVDLFAGSGALGIEALSRGAARATFVEADRRALAALRRNLQATGLADRATVVAGDAFAHLARLAPGQRYDLALCDPPYRFDRWDELLAALPADRVVAESAAEVAAPAGWALERHRRYGSTVVTFLVPSGPVTVDADAPNRPAPTPG